MFIQDMQPNEVYLLFSISLDMSRYIVYLIHYGIWIDVPQ